VTLRTLHLASIALWAPLALCASLSLAGRALADDGPPEPENLEQKIKAQLEKIARLMKENEAALLEASRGSGKRPDGPDVKPPDGEAPPAMQPEKPPEGPSPAGRGEEVRKRIEELLKTTQQSGGAIPKEIEELIKMIPIQISENQDQPDDDPKKNQEGEARKSRDQRAPDGKDPKSPDKTEDPAKKPYTSDSKPPEGDKGDPPKNEMPPWIVGLPPEQQRKIMNGDTKDVPPEYRALVERYIKWLNEHSGTK
jgi:hypothetical protein